MPSVSTSRLSIWNASTGSRRDESDMLWLDGIEVPEDGWVLDLQGWTLTIVRPAFQPRHKYHFGIYADVSDIETLAPVVRRPQAKSPMVPS